MSQVVTNTTHKDTFEGKAYTDCVAKTYTYPIPPAAASDVRGTKQKYFRLFRWFR